MVFLPILVWVGVNLPFALLVGWSLRIHNRRLAEKKDEASQMKNTLSAPVMLSLGAWFIFPAILIPVLTARSAGALGAVLGIVVVAIAYVLGHFLELPIGGILI